MIQLLYQSYQSIKDYVRAAFGAFITIIMPFASVLPVYIQVLGGLFGLVLIIYSIKCKMLDYKLKKIDLLIKRKELELLNNK